MKKKKKMNRAELDVTAQVLTGISQLLPVEYVDLGDDDDVFISSVPELEIYSDMDQMTNNAKPKTAEEVQVTMRSQTGRTRRPSDVIDSLGEEIVCRGVTGSEPFSIPVSPRNRISSDLGYSGSFASSPSSNVNNAFNYGLRRGSTVTDSRPITVDEPTGRPDEGLANMPVARDSETYNMNHPRRGRAVIFNNDVFENNMATPRTGSEIDVTALDEALRGLSFQVSIYDNLTHHEIKEVVYNLSREDHSDADCVLIAVLTHGQDKGLLYARDALYRVESLWTPFNAENCRTLAGKPKLFFIQACRGDGLDGGVTLISQRRSMSETDSGSSAAYKIPNYCDFLLSFSSMEGYFSWRNPEDGTWYVQSLVRELKEHGDKKNLIDVLTKVHRRVALFYESNVADLPWMNRQKQCPVYHSTLMRDLIFSPKD